MVLEREFERINCNNEGGRQKAEGGRNPFCNEDLGSPLQKLFALKGEVLDPIVSIITQESAK
jgi:hypothetical protein